MCKIEIVLSLLALTLVVNYLVNPPLSLGTPPEYMNVLAWAGIVIIAANLMCTVALNNKKKD